ncbi:glycerol-3-phosphate 1-O-acyltransferase PlsY [Alteribacillus bidgolensis]|uniref:Glycerol-3-phosphate acyltransferase n=1 Tax=Alteribacillus bidgolensis TaxID=930129 RepID=A0A1G8C404_9BACI|nr:glycerol-3-phosphate 1-O-acyltransferase PlsY [Alteribacillus bidgolensis]SDH40084.1 acyl-phosphate glycerol-3-phosphate acyltransferase [Alteribacillus bidgolensis]
MELLVSIIAAYLLGSISFSYVIAQKMMKIDIRQHGSGNAGATNILRVLGKGPAILVLSLDIFKGIAAVWFAKWLEMSGIFPVFTSLGEMDGLAPALAGLAAILGHNWPVYYGFKGGKGVATAVGVVGSLVFFPAVYVGIVSILAIVVTRYVSLGSLIFAAATPILIWFTKEHYGHPDPYFYLTALLGLMSVWKHRTNVERLIKGTENKIGEKKLS